MEGVLPMSLSLSDDSARLIGSYTRRALLDVVRPPLDRIEAHLRGLNDALAVLSIDVVDVFNGITDRRLKVQVMNESMLDNIEAIRWAVAYLSYNTFLELLDNIRYMRWLDGRSHIHLHDIIAAVMRLESLTASFATEVSGMGSQIIGLLQQILDEIRHGIPVFGVINVIVTGAGPLDGLDLWKLLGLLGLLALGLALIVAFLFGVGAALATFTAGAILAAGAIAVLVGALIPLMNTLAGYDWEQLGKIAVGFAAIAVFVAALGKAFQLVTSDLTKIVPQLKTFFEAITALMTAIAGFDWGQLAKIAAGFAGIAVFVAALGKAFQMFTTDLDKVVPHLKTFFEAITALMTTIAGFDWSQLAKIALGFAAIAGFVALLGKAFSFVTADLEKIVPQLNAFFDSITKLMTAIAGFDWGQMAKIAVGFLLIAGFVWLLGKALDTLTEKAISAIGPLASFFTAITALMTAIAGFSVGQLVAIAAGFALIALFVWGLSMAMNTMTAQTVAALPGLTGLIAALTQLAALMAGMSAGEMITMAIGLALVAAFVWAVAAALVYAAGPLASVAAIMGGLGGIMSMLSGIGSFLSGVIGGIGSALSGLADIAGSVFSAIGDGISSITGGIADAAGAVAGFAGDAIGAIGDVAGDIGGGISDAIGGVGDFLFGSDDSASLDVSQSTQFASALPPPPPPAPVLPEAPALGALGTGGALAAAPAAGATSVDQTVNAGGINIAINAERLEADSASLLTDDIIAQLQARLGALRSTQDFQAGGRPAAA
ncbi:hypothetical protein Afil01_34170 [Actinorhabdospora filicis]|uniref:Uncharacterized protein n=1 Tax=Actinorhabdospora filicis TaxID=1785913 RepID=A0A9W6SKD1_9ACTN|nr:hypothetical protein Afil01_34170 [Actinorhabdospora filicis]